jgi:protein gp37
MNRTRIEWCNFTWNPVVGCKRGCPYCYARKIYQRFKPDEHKFEDITFYPNRLLEPNKIKKPSKIFVGSMSDICYWQEWVLRDVIKVAIDNPQHIFMFLTKSPEIYESFHFPKNCYLGITWTGTETDWESKMYNQNHGWVGKKNIKFISLEPILGDNFSFLTSTFVRPDWIICGGLTPRSFHKKEWIDRLLEYCKVNSTPIFLKSNLHYSIKIQEYPK